jgi:hypothetical protein
MKGLGIYKCIITVRIKVIIIGIALVILIIKQYQPYNTQSNPKINNNLNKQLPLRKNKFYL